MFIRICCHLCLILGLFPVFNRLEARTIRVPADAGSIQAAIDSSVTCDSIIVAPGTYQEQLVIDKDGITLIGKKGVFSPAELDPGVTIDGQGLGITMLISGNRVTISGFKIINGKGSGPNSLGGNISCTGSSALISYCVIAEGTTALSGEGGSLGHGGGISIEGSQVMLVGNKIVNNRAWGYGGGINCRLNSEVWIINNIIDGNRADFGGGINLEGCSGIYILNNIIKHNQADFRHGGGLFFGSGAKNIRIFNNTIIYNRAKEWGAGGAMGMQVDTDAGIDIFNNIIAFNENPKENSNDQTLSGGIYCLNAADGLSFRNNCFYGNEHSDFLGCEAGRDALFVNPEISSSGILKADSPCIDKGVDLPAFLIPPFDAAFSLRIQNDLIDIGAYEFGESSYGLPQIISDPVSQTVCTGQTAVFSVAIVVPASEEAVRYQWFKDGCPINSFADNTLTIENVQESDAGQYACVAYTLFGITASSKVATLEICPPELTEDKYRYPFQNFDDDVDVTRSFSNLWGGNSGRVDGEEGKPQFSTSYTTEGTRTGKGRALVINYGPLDGWSLYAESFEKKWFDRATSLNLNNLFPDFRGSGFTGRQIDAVAFHYRLAAADTLTIQLEVEDANQGKATIAIDLSPGGEWQEVTVSLDQFKLQADQPFDASMAKFLGFTFSDYVDGAPKNTKELGTLFLDDIYLIEEDFTKPDFSNQKQLLQYLNKVSFRHFWMAVDPSTFFALDRHIWDDLISVDAIGFQLSAYVIAHKNNWVDQDKIKNRIKVILKSLVEDCKHATNIQQVIDKPLQYATVNGIWAHFLSPDSLGRKDAATEYSLFSNALLLSGVIVAMQYFKGDSEINSYGRQLLELSDWRFLYRQEDQLMYYDWKPETGYSQAYTDWWTEELDLAFLLGINTSGPQRRLPDNPYFSPGYRRPVDPADNHVFSAPGANFTYTFLQMYARFSPGSDRFENAKNALFEDYFFPQNTLGDFTWPYDHRIFGITACEGSDGLYHAYGYCSKLDRHNDPNGTIAVYGSGSSILFIPNQAIAALSYYYNELDEAFWDNCAYGFWSPVFGFPDAFHLDPDNAYDNGINKFGFNGPWLSVPRFSIDVGPMLMNIDSYLSEQANELSIRDLFSSFDPIAEQLPVFQEIAVNNIPEKAVIRQLNDPKCDGSLVILQAEVEHAGLVDFEYQWKLEGQVIGGNSPQLQLLTFAAEKQISCDVIITLEKCGYQYISSSAPFTIKPGEGFTTSVGNNSPLCEGERIQLKAGGGDSYLWEGPNGFSSVLQNPITDAPGKYYVTIAKDNGCKKLDSTEVVNFLPLPAYDISNDSPKCEGESVRLKLIGAGVLQWDGPEGFSSFQPNVEVTVPGDYSVTLTDGNGCTALATTEVQAFLTPPLIELPDSITVSMGSTIALPMQATGAISFSWEGPDGFEATTPNPLVNTSGVYYLTAWSVDGCFAKDSITVMGVVSTFSTFIEFKMQVFPNPFSHSVQLLLEGVPPSEGLLTIYNGQGQHLLQKEVRGPNIEERIDLSAFPPGLYWINVRGKDWKSTGRIVKL